MAAMRARMLSEDNLLTTISLVGYPGAEFKQARRSA